jgi:N-acetyl-anhydromuramyl-L-alanine amidase AmpD
MFALVAMAAFTGPAIMTRAEWGAGPVILQPKRHEIKYITIHHTGVAQKPAVDFKTKLQNLQKWCQREDTKSFAPRVKPPWPDIPYHYYIDCHGKIAEGRPAVFVGDTNTTYDPTGHLLIVLEGNFEKEPVTEAQFQALNAMTRWAAEKYRVPRVRIKGHGDYAQTDCPGKPLTAYLPKLRASF